MPKSFRQWITSHQVAVLKGIKSRRYREQAIAEIEQANPHRAGTLHSLPDSEIARLWLVEAWEEALDQN